MTSLPIKVAALDALAISDLRVRWVRLVGTPAPRLSANMLRLALAWEMQARAWRPVAVDQPDARPARRWSHPHLQGTSGHAAGARMAGPAYVVEVGEDEVIRWNGQTWRSLSEVARAITGTRWSGPAYFGLKAKVVAA